MGLVGGGQDFRLVNIVNAKGFQDLGLHEVADADLGHHRDGNRVHNAGYDSRVGHARHAAVGANVCRHPLQRHDSHGPGFGGNQGLLRRNHVHDYAALEHLGVSSLHGKSAGQNVCNRHIPHPSPGGLSATFGPVCD